MRGDRNRREIPRCCCCREGVAVTEPCSRTESLSTETADDVEAAGMEWLVVPVQVVCGFVLVVVIVVVADIDDTVGLVWTNCDRRSKNSSGDSPLVHGYKGTLHTLPLGHVAAAVAAAVAAVAVLSTAW